MTMERGRKRVGTLGRGGDWAYPRLQVCLFLEKCKITIWFNNFYYFIFLVLRKETRKLTVAS